MTNLHLKVNINQEAKIRTANETTIYLQFAENKKENKNKEFYPER